MERERNNTGLVVAVTVLTMLVLGLAGFIVYDKVINNNTKEPNNNEVNNNLDNNGDDVTYKISDVTDVELQRINNFANLWESVTPGDSYGWTGGEIVVSGSRSIDVGGTKTNKISVNSDIKGFTIAMMPEGCDYLACKTSISSFAFVVLLETGSVYLCDHECMHNASSEKDMELLLTDKAIIDVAEVDDKLFVKTNAGIKKIIYAK